MLSIEIIENGDNAIVNLIGIINFETTMKLRDSLSKFREYTYKNVILNLANVRLIDSSGLGLLVAAKNTFERHDKKFKLCGISPIVKKIFIQTNLIVYFDVYADVNEALNVID